MKNLAISIGILAALILPFWIVELLAPFYQIIGITAMLLFILTLVAFMVAIVKGNK